MTNNQSIVLVEDGIPRGVSKGHRALVFRNGELTTVDGEGNETPAGASTSSVQAALAADADAALLSGQLYKIGRVVSQKP